MTMVDRNSSFALHMHIIYNLHAVDYILFTLPVNEPHNSGDSRFVRQPGQKFPREKISIPQRRR